MVGSTFSGSVVAKTKTRNSGGSSTTFSRALKPCVVTAVAGGVDLDDVERARAVGGERHAGAAQPARVRRGPLLAVQRAGQDPRRRRLATAPRAAEQVGVVDPAAVDGVHQR